MNIENKNSWLSIKNEMVIRMSNKAIGMNELNKVFNFTEKIFDEHEAQLREAIKPKTCKLCAYCEPFNSVCFNDKSPLCADFVNSEYGCIYWERKDNA